jgi:hypothetical protein
VSAANSGCLSVTRRRSIRCGTLREATVWQPAAMIGAEASSGALIRTLEPTRLPVSVLQFDRSGSRLEKGEVFVWNTSDWSLVRTFDLEHDRDQTSQCVTLHPDGSLLAVYYLKPARVVLLDITDTEQGSYPIVYAAIPGPG